MLASACSAWHSHGSPHASSQEHAAPRARPMQELLVHDEDHAASPGLAPVPESLESNRRSQQLLFGNGTATTSTSEFATDSRAHVIHTSSGWKASQAGTSGSQMVETLSRSQYFSTSKPGAKGSKLFSIDDMLTRYVCACRCRGCKVEG